MFEGTAENIASVLAMIVGVSLALGTALGPLVTYLVEAIKATELIKDGYSGLVAVGVGMLLGMGLTGLTDLMAAEPYSLGTMLLLGAFVGAIMGAGGIRQYKASASINTKPALEQGLAEGRAERTNFVTYQDLDKVAGPAFEAKQFVDDVKAAAAQEHRARMSPPEPASMDTRPTGVEQMRARAL
jgi:hypothetical protein